MNNDYEVVIIGGPAGLLPLSMPKNSSPDNLSLRQQVKYNYK